MLNIFVWFNDHLFFGQESKLMSEEGEKHFENLLTSTHVHVSLNLDLLDYVWNECVTMHLWW